MATLELSVGAICDFVEVYTEVATAGDALKYVKAGYARFLAALDIRTGKAHRWSFMQPSTTITLTVAGEGAYDLPADFGGLVEKPIYPYSSTLTTLAVEEVTPEAIYSYWRNTDTAGVPRYYSILAKAFVAATGQRYQMLCAPVPEDERTWNYRYLVSALDITDDAAVFMLGGATHSYAIRQFALADAEMILGHTSGVQEERAQKMLAESIDADKLLFTSHSTETLRGGP